MLTFKSKVIDSLARIETKLDSGEKKFEELKETHDWVEGFKGYLKALAWVSGIGLPVISGIVIWYITQGP